MPEKIKPLAPDRDDSVELKQLSTEELQQRLDVHSLYASANSQQLPVQDLLNELRVHQIELEMQRRELCEAQRELEEAHNRYADLYDYAPVCYINFDSSGVIREINQAGVSLLGQGRRRLLGKPFSLWLARGDNGRAFFGHLKQARLSGQVETIELRLQPSGRAQLDVRLETVIAQEEIAGKPSFRCVIIDISAQKGAEWEIKHQAQQLELITDAIPGYIAYVDLQGVLQFANKAYARWVRKSRAEIIGKKHADVIWQFTKQRIEHYIIEALAGRSVNFETSIITPDGQRQNINVNYIPDFAEDGSVLGYFIVNQDVTELRRHETMEKMHLLEMARVSRINTMGEMVAELAHELNQPLAAITIYSDALNRMLNKSTTGVSEISGTLSEIRYQAERAGEVIRRLKEFVSKRELLMEEIQLNDVVREVMNLINVEAGWYDTRVRLELGDNLPIVKGDRILIEQVILNLARNAIEAMEAVESQKRVLSIRTGMNIHDSVELAVEDSGPGIEADELEKIFEPFFTSKLQGMGLGLAISRNIIKAHQGRLWAISNEDGGMTFALTLPQRQEN